MDDQKQIFPTKPGKETPAQESAATPPTEAPEGFAEMQVVLDPPPLFDTRAGPQPARHTAIYLPPMFSTAHAHREFRLFVPALVALIMLAGWVNLAGLLYVLWPVHIIAIMPLIIGTLATSHIRLSPDIRPKPLPLGDLPHYTVLVPLYDEANMLPQLKRSLAALIYPADRLEILLLMEFDDLPTRQAAHAMDWPKTVQQPIIPPAQLQTKPAACNYALALARGDLITVYDAEDKPHPLQLIAAATRFQAGDTQLACLQGPLHIDVTGAGWLQRQFALEYDLLFDIALPIMARLRLAIPLGGTSNHFRTETLRRLGGWDSSNLTEDADLGFRLARHGYRTAILPMETVENAPACLSDWNAQRTRWLSGHLQCWHLHMRYPLICLRQMGLAGFVFFNAIFMARLFAGLTPVLFLLALALQAGATVIHTAPFAPDMLFMALSAVVYAIHLVAAFMQLRMMAWPARLMMLATMPVYWILTLPCLLRAIWRMGCGNIKWLKSPHLPY